ncbi:MAG: FecR domain-containing protein [Spirochaetales bacterium]|nr:FecR domain-containing protein [Spirochaetales bacterium]
MKRNTDDRFEHLAGLKLLQAATPQDEEEWKELTRQSPDLATRFQKLQSLDRLLASLPDDVQLAIQEKVAAPGSSTLSRRFFLPGAALAATILLALWFLVRQEDKVEQPLLAYQFELEAGACQYRAGGQLEKGATVEHGEFHVPLFCVLRLKGEDRFRLTLTANSSFQLAQPSGGLDIRLERGQALIEEASRPENYRTSLIIGDARATLIGTRLSGRVEDSRARFQVLEGEIRLQQSLLNLSSSPSLQKQRSRMEEALGRGLEISLRSGQETALSLGNLPEKERLLGEIRLLLEQSASAEEIATWKEMLPTASKSQLLLTAGPAVKDLSPAEILAAETHFRFPGAQAGNVARGILFIHLKNGTVVSGEILATEPEYRIRTADGQMLSIPGAAVQRISSDP